MHWSPISARPCWAQRARVSFTQASSVARFTRRLVPVMALRLAASRGEREALDLLSAHDPAWVKIRAANDPESKIG